MFQLRQKITTEQEGVVESHLATDNNYSKKLRLGFLQIPPLQEEFPNEVLEAIPPLTQKFGLHDLRQTYLFTPTHMDYMKELPITVATISSYWFLILSVHS